VVQNIITKELNQKVINDQISFVLSLFRQARVSLMMIIAQNSSILHWTVCAPIAL